MKYADENAEVVLAVNLENAVSPESVLARARDSDLLKKSGIDPETFAKQVSSVQGIAFGATIHDGIYGKVEVNFGESASALAPVAKQLIVEVMDGSGLHLSDLDSWKAETNGGVVSLEGPLSTSSFRRILSFMDTPAQHLAVNPRQSPGAPGAKAQADAGPPNTATITKNYFDAVVSYVNDLKGDYGQGGHTYTLNATWCDKFANMIDALPIQGVDPQMLDFGNFVSQALRNASLGLTTTRETRDVRDANLMAYGGGAPYYQWRRFGYYGYGYGYPYASSLASTVDKMDIAQQGRSAAIDSMAAMFEDLANRERDVRRAMAEKYPNF